MLDADTKRRIDTARDILVGKVPDPKSQVEQITIAMIYKFMDDIDAESEELGGERTFFAGDFARYGWAKLMHPGLGGHETLNLYADGIDGMPENPGIPPLFRDIFNNAYLPYRDPETLRAFLKVIDGFTYDHSERLGDAFEYLLSVLGSQGDAGQFRTPRHIIDFIVSIVDPKKDEVVLDPACGTAGFLISSYKHIVDANTDEDGNSALTPGDRERLAANFQGYDISPDMVRLSLVNMYLHGFVAPHIFEYDTLTSDDRWDEYADVILANPPFMSPKGGIRPHSRFSVQSKRSEVLFVDYMAEHLTPAGRAGIIVPEGIIFQSQKAHKQLRKMLVAEYLVAVVSLPGGVFNPYSGVKTSILVLDKALAAKSDRIAFFKVENDGFELGAQRRPIGQNDLPQVRAEIVEYLRSLRAGKPTARVAESSAGYTAGESTDKLGLLVEKDKLASDGEYNLSGERYRIQSHQSSNYELVPFEAVCTLEYGASLPKSKRVDGPYPVMGSNGISGYHNEYLTEGPAIIVGRKGSAGEVTYVESNCFPIDTTYYVKLTNPRRANLGFIYLMLKSLSLPNLREGAGVPGLNRKDVYTRHKLPLPPLEVQKETVAEIEGYQKIIDGARVVVDNYRPRITIDPEWPIVSIGDYSEVRGGKRLPRGTQYSEMPTNHRYIRVADFWNQSVNVDSVNFISKEIHQRIQRYTILSSNVYISIAGTIGLIGTIPEQLNGSNLTENAAKIVIDEGRLDKNFLAAIGSGDAVQEQIRTLTHAVGVPKLALQRIRTLKIPLPPLTTQQAIVAEIEAEKALVDANRELIERFEKKIRDVIERVWDEAPI